MLAQKPGQLGSLRAGVQEELRAEGGGRQSTEHRGVESLRGQG